jgi:ribonuclease G|tara:strand:- start:22861 stop:24354 length:1494 start_codon:yes stop_codon:yes gene_type:complete
VSEEILINITPQETRVAVVENGMLQEVHIERNRARGIVGNIYKGRVVRVLPGMQAAFIEVGLERTAFLHAADVIRPEMLESNGNTNGNGKNGARQDLPIHGLLHDGEEIMVQVVKDALGTKGARLTTQIAIPARHLVFLPYSCHIGISQRIQDEAVRTELRETVERLRGDPDSGGYIIRTAAEQASEEELTADIVFLNRVWKRVQERSEKSTGSCILHEDIPLALRVLRDLVDERIEKIRIDSHETFEKASEFVRDLIPEVSDRIEWYPGERPIFDLYSVEDEIQKAINKEILLKSGGHLVIDQTEALTTVDVNTGGFVGRQNLEETLFKTNLEAAQSIARQLRLRNIGGIIIIDFIDMEDPEHCRQVMRTLEKAMAHDRVKVFIHEMSSLGLVEVTRKRTSESLERQLTQTCTLCSGRGVIKTAETVCYEIFREILRESRQFEANGFTVVASESVIDLLLDEESTGLADLQEFISTPINLHVESGYPQETFDVVPI